MKERNEEKNNKIIGQARQERHNGCGKEEKKEIRGGEAMGERDEGCGKGEERKIRQKI